MDQCELLADCGFFAKYQATQSLACRGFIKAYCEGELKENCARKRHRQLHGEPPPDDMLPSGQQMPKGFR